MSIQIGRVRGIPIRLHFTLLIVFALIIWTIATGFMPVYFPGLTSTEYWIMGVLGAIILFVSVLLHELAHSIVALGYGLEVRQIILFIFGGVSDIPKEPRDFDKEFRITIAGPATSFALSAIFAVIWWGLVQTGASGALRVAEGVMLYGATLNALVGVFNLVPAFPLDGGRILRAGLYRYKKDYNRATEIAAKVGIGISYGFMAFGFIITITGSFVGGIWLLLIGWFLNSGAQSYLSQHELKTALSGVRLAAIMNQNVIAINERETVAESLRNYFGRYMKSAFPVVNDNDVLVGMASLPDLAKVDQRAQTLIRIEETMVSRKDLIVMGKERSANDAFMQMVEKGQGKVFVNDESERLIGIVSKTDILNVANERKEYDKVKKSFVAEEKSQKFSEAS